jgi:hypothetical protein
MRSICDSFPSREDSLALPAVQGRPSHHRRGIGNEDDHQPTQHLDGHFPDDEGCNQTAGKPPNVNASTILGCICSIWIWRTLALETNNTLTFPPQND